MTGPVIRRARDADLDALLELEQTGFATDRLSRRQYRRHLHSATARVLVADEGGLLGSAVVLVRANSRIARLHSLVVAAAARGRGAGAALLDEAMRTAGAMDCQRMRLEVRTDNGPAIALYERHGFRRFARLEDYYADGAAAWRYQRELEAPD